MVLIVLTVITSRQQTVIAKPRNVDILINHAYSELVVQDLFLSLAVIIHMSGTTFIPRNKPKQNVLILALFEVDRIFAL